MIKYDIKINLDRKNVCKNNYRTAANDNITEVLILLQTRHWK